MARHDREIDDRPLTIKRLAEIKAALPEHERWAFTLALREDVYDQLFQYECRPAVCAAGEGVRHGV